MDWFNIIIWPLVLAIVPIIGTIVWDIVKKKRKEEKQNYSTLKNLNFIINASVEPKINCNVHYFGRGSGKISISNDGNADAHNVNIQIISDTDGILFMKGFDSSNKSVQIDRLCPHTPFSYNFVLIQQHVEMIELRINWDDDFKKGNEKTITLQMP